DLHRQFADTNAGRVVHCVRNRRRNPGEPDLADPTSAEFVDLFIGIVEEVYVNRRRIRVYSHYVVCQIAVDGRATLRVVSSMLKECHANSHHDSALDLIPASERIQEATGVHHRYNAAHAQTSDLWLPRDLDKVTTERMH